MGNVQEKVGKWEPMDVLFEHISLKVEVRVPTADALTFDYTQRRRYGCKHIIAVKPGGTYTVVIQAENCTPYEAAEEYRHIVNALPDMG